MRPAPLLALLAAALPLAGAGCRSEEFALTDAGGTVSGSGVFADILGAFTPGVGTLSVAADGARALGPPDGSAVDLGDGGQLDVVFGAGGVIEEDGADLRVHALFGVNGSASVFASQDGVGYVFVGDLVGSSPGADGGAGAQADVDLTTGLLTEATYVRVVQQSGSVAVDAIEALHPVVLSASLGTRRAR